MSIEFQGILAFPPIWKRGWFPGLLTFNPFQGILAFPPDWLGEKMVQMAIDLGGDPQWKNRYDVFSREDCFDTERIGRHRDREIRDKFQPEHYFEDMLLCPTYFHPYPYAVNYDGDAPPPPQKESWRDHFKAANTIFYAAGVLHRVFEGLSSETMTVPDMPWQEQGHLWFDPERYKERYPLPFFTEGRNVLRRYNDRLNFAVDSETAPAK